jgi:alanine racemase
MSRWAWAEVDLDAIEHNVRVIRAEVEPASVWAVVKADAYGHGAPAVAEAALAAGAEGLCVALVQEGVALRNAGVSAPILLLSEQPPSDIPAIVEHALSPTVYTVPWVEALAASLPPEPPGASDDAEPSRGPARVTVHVKIDTGMQRVGVDPANAPEVVAAVRAAGPRVRLGGIVTHLAMADLPDDPATSEQLDRFDAVLDALGPLPSDVLVHIANSAGAFAHPRARRSVVRTGIGIYGISPGPAVDARSLGLKPAMSLHGRVSFVKRVAAGSGVSYGWRHIFDRDTTVATVPIGYADGVPRRLSQTGGQVLVGGRRCPIVGVVTMDQLMVDVGDAEVAVGDHVVLIGRQGEEEVRAEEWADRLDTIGYEIVCGISSRIERVLRRNINR